MKLTNRGGDNCGSICLSVRNLRPGDIRGPTLGLLHSGFSGKIPESPGTAGASWKNQLLSRDKAVVLGNFCGSCGNPAPVYSKASN